MSPEAALGKAERDEHARQMLDDLEAATFAKVKADDEITRLLVAARNATPPVPLDALAKATGLSVSGVSVRVARAGGR